MRELRLIAEHKPKYNRRSRFPERVHWVKLTLEPWPRLSLVRQVLDDDADYVGPFSSRQRGRARDRGAARDLPDPPVRRPDAAASQRSARARWPRWAVPLAVRRQRRRDGVRRARRRAPPHAARPAPSRWSARWRGGWTLLSAADRFEDAVSWRERLSAFLRGAARTQRLRALTRCPEVVAARREDDRLGGARRAVRPAGRGRGDPAGRARRASGSVSCRPRPRR